jgi:hypothetical protein
MPFTVNVGPYQGGAYLYGGLSSLGQGIGSGISEGVKGFQQAQQDEQADNLILGHALATNQITHDDWAKYMDMGRTQKNGVVAGLARNFAMDMQQKQIAEAAARSALYQAQANELTTPPQAFNLPLGPDTSQFIPGGIPGGFPATGPGSPPPFGLGQTPPPPTGLDLGGPPASLDLGTGQAPPPAPGVDLGAPAFAPQGFQRVTPGATQPVVAYRGQLKFIDQPGAGTPEPVYLPGTNTIIGYTGDAKLLGEAGIQAQTGSQHIEVDPVTGMVKGVPIPETAGGGIVINTPSGIKVVQPPRESEADKLAAALMGSGVIAPPTGGAPAGTSAPTATPPRGTVAGPKAPVNTPPPAPTDPGARTKDQIYMTPRGPLRWTGTGWIAL